MGLEPQHYWVAKGPFGGRAMGYGDDHLLMVMSEDAGQDGNGVRMTAKTVAGPFPTEALAREVLSGIIMSCPEYRTDETDLPGWEMDEAQIDENRRNMGLPI